jgi:hypothetical protein
MRVKFMRKFDRGRVGAKATLKHLLGDGVLGLELYFTYVGQAITHSSWPGAAVRALRRT